MTNTPPESSDWKKAIDTDNPIEAIFNIVGVAKRKISQSLGLSSPEDNPDSNVFLPEGVRYAIRYGIELKQKEILAVINSSHWQDEALYLLMKILDSDPILQEKFLEEVLNAYRSNQDVSVLQEIYKRHTAMLPNEASVIGTKLSQVSRSDKDHALYVITCLEDSCTLEEWTHHDEHQDIPEIHLCDDTVSTGQTLATIRHCLNEKYGDFFPEIKEKDYYLDQGIAWTSK